MPTRTPAPNGCLDPRLGVSDKRGICLVRPAAVASGALSVPPPRDHALTPTLADPQTCNKRLADCVGHFGYIKVGARHRSA